ncbi:MULTISPECIES: YaiI/YqxD family protein [unclassified Legionella]|uniref:YaiI/YqxD family protein n=1 Tax=unclassified Legionella TaxID=2622702 RepID=UPI0010555703|nr:MULTISPECIES: YaiI/YqxD family protein [unclassified Legionella]MDI9817808.1 YaiI/YqxD family protein [Legionella sp. PL877]
MNIWIDGDACPRTIKELLFRAAVRTKTYLIAVSNHNIAIPASPFIKKCQVGLGFDVADNYIVNHMKQGDLVITADIPLADAVITQGGVVLNPRGGMYTANNIKSHLALRNFNESLRSCNLLTGGPAKLSQKEVQNFANSLDRILSAKT